MKKPWTEDELNHAQRLREDGLTYGEIGRILNRTEKSVGTRLIRRGGSYEPSPCPFLVSDGGPTGEALEDLRRKQSAHVIEDARRPGETQHDALRRLS